MKKSYKGQSFFCELKYSLFDCLKQNKIKVIISLCVLLISLLTGIIIAVKYYDTSNFVLSGYGIADFSKGMISSSFFSRFFSMLLVLLLLFACSFTPWTFPLAIFILAYRTYLLGLNLTLMFILFGVPGIVVSLIIALPCQLIVLFVLLFSYILLYNNSCTCKRFGSAGQANQKFKILLFALLLLLVCNLFESLILVIFNVNVILVI